MAEDLSKIKYFSRDETHVFWNLEDYPIPSRANLDSIYPNIASALHKMGFHGYVSILAHGDKLNHSKSDLSKAKIRYLREEVSGGENSTVWTMSMDIITSAALGFSNLVVIAKQQNPESELHRVLQCVKSRSCTVLLIEPPADTAESDSLFHSVDSVVDCTQVLGGGRPYCASDTETDEDAKSFIW